MKSQTRLLTYYDHFPAERPKGTEAADTIAAAIVDHDRVGGEEQLEVVLCDAQLPEERHADVVVAVVALLRLGLPLHY